MAEGSPRARERDGLPGRLQRGRGDGARTATRERATDEVLACVRVDRRWDWQVDDRCGYLARLVRDLEIPIEPIVRQLRDSADPNDPRDQSHEFSVAVRVLELLALGGDAAARQALLDYIGHGRYWIDALESVALTFPPEDWRGLYRQAADRLSEADIQNLYLDSDPWRTWLAEHPGFAARCADRLAERDQYQAERKRVKVSTERLLAVLRDPDEHRAAKGSALLRLSRRTVPLEVLDLAESLTYVDPLLGEEMVIPWLPKVVYAVGPAAVGHARRWAAEPDRPLAWIGHRLLAGHGDQTDLPVLAAEIDRRLGEDDDNWCGYDDLLDGMPRLGVAETPGSPLASRTVEQLEYLWRSTPHSRERDSYLRGLIAFNVAEEPVVEGLWDCEEYVRLLSVTAAPLTSAVRGRLAELRADPLETNEIRAAAATRLT